MLAVFRILRAFLSYGYVSRCIPLVKLILGSLCMLSGIGLIYSSPNLPPAMTKIMSAVEPAIPVIALVIVILFLVVFYVLYGVFMLILWAMEAYKARKHKALVANAETLTTRTFETHYDEKRDAIEVAINGLRIEYIKPTDDRLEFGSDFELRYKRISNREQVLVSVVLPQDFRQKIYDLRSENIQKQIES